jgi:GBP family porin
MKLKRRFRMNKKVMTLAVAAALAGPAAAFAQVEIGGSIHLQWFQHEPGTPAEKKTDILETTEPEVYIRAEEKLGGGLSAWMQCTSSFDVVGSAIDGFCGRNSGIGFKGGFGNIFAGNWDTPHKLAVSPMRGWFGLNNAFARATILWNTAPSNVGNGFVADGVTANAAGFSRRQKETLNWHGPDWGGFSLQAAISGGNSGTSLTEASPLSPRLYSLGAKFGTGGLLVTAGYEQHNDFNPTGSAAYTGGTDKSYVVGVSYTFAGRFKLSGVYTKNEYEVGTGTGATLDADGFGAWIDWTIAGPHSIKAQYILQNDPKGTAGTTVNTYTVGSDRGAQVATLVYSYAFSKRTSTYVAYNQVKNDTNTNAFTLGQTGTATGATQKAYGVGMRYSF